MPSYLFGALPFYITNKNIQMKKKHLFYGVIVSSLLYLVSCVDNNINLKNVDNTIAMDGAMVLPLAQSTVTLEDFINKLNVKNITTNSSNVLTVNYTPTISNSFNLNITPQSVTTNLSSNISAYAGTTLSKAAFNTAFGASHPITVTINLSGVSSNISRIDSIYINSASITVTSFSNNVLLQVIPNSTCLPGMPQYTRLGSFTISLSNQWVKAINNQITLSLIATTTASSVTIPPSPTLSAAFNISSFKDVFGQFFYSLAAQTGTVDLSFLNSAISSSSYLPFQNPTIKIFRTTNVGVPMQLNIGYLKSYNSATPATYRSATFSTNPQSFPSVPTTPGQTITDSLVFNNANGNISNLFTLSGINTLAYSFGAQNASSTAEQYIMSSNTFKVWPTVNIPLSFNPSVDIQFLDTVSLGSSFSNFLNKNNIDDVKFWLTVDNYTSSKITISATLLDSIQQVVSSTATQTITVNTTLNVNSSGVAEQAATTTDQQSSIEFTASDIKKAKYIKLSYVLAGKDVSTSLTLVSTDFIKVKLSAYVQGSVSLNNN
jgi:hypothetical protein